MKSLSLLFLVFTLYATPLRVYYDYDRAVNLALKEHKKILLINKKENCRWCKKLINETLQDKSVKKEINSRYILVIVDNANSNYPVRFYSASVPATFIVNPNNRVEDDMAIGYIKPQRFLSLIK